ncbi:MAG: hypothetical protein H6579_11075 [Chitinophagales bacterium]|nr:hypothetical protein [Chitinophagales bacterium]
MKGIYLVLFSCLMILNSSAQSASQSAYLKLLLPAEEGLFRGIDLKESMSTVVNKESSRKNVELLKSKKYSTTYDYKYSVNLENLNVADLNYVFNASSELIYARANIYTTKKEIGEELYTKLVNYYLSLLGEASQKNSDKTGFYAKDSKSEFEIWISHGVDEGESIITIEFIEMEYFELE